MDVYLKVTRKVNVFVKCKPGGSTQRSTVLPERAGVDAYVNVITNVGSSVVQ